MQSRTKGTAQRLPRCEAMHIGMVTTRVILRHTRSGGVVAHAESKTEDMAGVEEKEAMWEAKDIMMSETEIATITMTETETEMDRGVLATNHYSNPA
jgi:hypothetical protein